MLNLMDKHAVIRLKKEGHSNRSLEKMLGINRKTIGKYWNDYLKDMSQLETGDCDLREIQEKIAAPPKYDVSKRQYRKYTEAMDEFLDDILASEKKKDAILGTHKQKRTNEQIYQLVLKEGFAISQSTISNHIRIKRDKHKECFIRQQYDFGDRLEYDFGEVKLVIDGTVQTLHLAVLSSPASDFRWAYLYKNQKKDVFMDSHVRFFKMTGGIYKEVVYDNMRNVVAKFIGRSEKVLNPDLLILSNYYDFRINVTNCFKGNEKGHVEGSVKIIRNQVFAEKYEFFSYEQACLYLENRLIKMNEKSGIKDEVKVLQPAPPPFELGKLSEPKVDTYSFVQVENRLYSVPDYLVGKKVTVKSYVDVVKIYANTHFVCEHKKKDGDNEISIDINHYLHSLSKKPGALRNSLALKSIPLLKSIFDNHFSTNPKRFIEILIKNHDKSMEELLSVFKDYDVFTDGVDPIDTNPSQKIIAIKTRELIAGYKNLCVGGHLS